MDKDEHIHLCVHVCVYVMYVHVDMYTDCMRVRILMMNVCHHCHCMHAHNHVYMAALCMHGYA